MKPTQLRRHRPEERVALAMEIASYFDEGMVYDRSVELHETDSQLPLTDLNSDGMLLARLAAAFDGYDFEFAEENEHLYYRFYVHLLAAAMCPLICDDHGLEQAIEDAKALIRERRDREKVRVAQGEDRTASGRILIPMIGGENFDDL